MGTENREIFTITFTVPIVSSTGNVSVFQLEGNEAVLKQTVPATNNQFVSFENDTTVSLWVLNSAINRFNVPYYVRVDNDFAKEQSNGQNVIGIRDKIWNFTTTSSSALNSGAAIQKGGKYFKLYIKILHIFYFQYIKFILISLGTERAIIRLTPEGTNYYISLPSKDKTKFENAMSDELAKAISCERDRLSTVGYQYDAHTKQKQVIMRVDIKKATAPEQTDSEKLVKNLNDTVTYKDITSLATGSSASHLDASNGAPQTENLWKKYWGFLLAAMILFLILFFLFFWAHLKNKDGRNFLPIFLSALIPIDIAFDIAFMSLHGRDYPWVIPATVFFFIFPLLLNLLLTNKIIKKEKTQKARTVFNKWWKDHRTSANVFRTASYLDTDALQVVSSRAAGIESLSAPFSDEGDRLILFASGAVLLFEDIPQFIIYSVYMSLHIKPAIVPILVLSSCLIVIVLKSSALLCCTCCYSRKTKQQDTEKVISSGGSSSSSSSSSESDDEKDYAPAPNTTNTFNIPTRTQDKPQDGDVHDRSGVGPQDNPQDESEKEPIDKDNAKPVDTTPTTPIKATEEKPTTGKPTDKKTGFTGLFGRKKSKDTTTITSDIGKDTKDTTTTTTTSSTRPNVDSTIRDSTVEEFNNGQKYLKSTENEDEKDDNNLAGKSIVTGYSGGGGGLPYINFGGSSSSSSTTTTKTEKLNIATGASIAGVTVAGGEAVRYIVITSEKDVISEKNEKVKPISTIKTTTTKTSSSDIGDRYTTRTDNGKEYITTTSTGGKYITKSSTGDEEYTTTSISDEEFITRSTSGEEYITMITTTTRTIKTTITTTSSDIDKEYITKLTNRKGEYVLTTLSSENFESNETFRTISSTAATNRQTNISSSTENGIETIIQTVIETDENGVTTTTVTTTKKDSTGKVIDTKTETKQSHGTIQEEPTIITRGDKTTTTTKTSSSIIPTNRETNISSSTDEDGIETITKTVKETDENGIITTTVTITKKDKTGKELGSNTEVTQSKESIITTSGGETTTRSITGSSKTPTRKQTRTFTNNETDEHGFLTVTVTTETINEDGTTTTTVTKTRKDPSGKEVDSNTETIYGATEFATEPEETITTSGSETTTRIITSGSKAPTRKQTRTFSENGTTTEITEEIEINDDGTTTTKTTTTKKDSNGNVIESNTEVKQGIAEESSTSSKTVTSSSSSRFGSSIIGPSIFQEYQQKKERNQ
ncbi:hypothetical protein C1645_145892 [Glomus cerebriforme]|uniref:Uncharacterized protein n=1 Tax=Glomus cerebriforme TaxID=658196 RepID=A0A397T6H8_9GLOM|nr:hypothetical protein C1645_145892 [Glomus cerebriforme]